MHEFIPQKAKICKHARKKVLLFGILKKLKRIFEKFEKCNQLIKKHAFAWKSGL